jgi:hypothetical protein
MRHRADAGIAGCGPALQPESVIADILDREPTVEGLGEQVGDPPLDCSRPRAHLGVIKDRARIIKRNPNNLDPRWPKALISRCYR